jgi:hypothetical protein
VKRLEAAGTRRRTPRRCVTKADLDAAVTRLEQKVETLLWKHTLGILLGVLTAACCCASSS